MFIRVTASIDASPGFVGQVVEAFPLRARILIMTQPTQEIPGQQGSFIGGMLQYAPIYDPADGQVGNDADLATIQLRHTQLSQISVVDSYPLALDLDRARYFLQINADVHVYTQDEVTQYNNVNGTNFTLQQVNDATQCQLNIFSITRVRSVSRLPPFINDQNLRYTIPQRPVDA